MQEGHPPPHEQPALRKGCARGGATRIGIGFGAGRPRCCLAESFIIAYSLSSGRVGRLRLTNGEIRPVVVRRRTAPLRMGRSSG